MYSGCQFSLYPMSDDFVEIILNAVGGLRERTDLRVETDDLSTLLVGPPRPLFATVEACFLKAALAGEHVVLNVTFSRGCPGEPNDPICQPDPAAAGADPIDPATVSPRGVEVAGQFALYPLGIDGYMDVIAGEIQATRQAGTFAGSKHFCTRLEGDIARVFATLLAAFERAASAAGHVVITATISKGSPTPT